MILHSCRIPTFYRKVVSNLKHTFVHSRYNIALIIQRIYLWGRKQASFSYFLQISLCIKIMTELVQRSFCFFTYTKVGIGNYALEFRFLGGNYNLKTIMRLWEGFIVF